MCIYITVIISLVLTCITLFIIMASKPLPLTTAIAVNLLDNHILLASSVAIEKNTVVTIHSPDLPDDLVSNTVIVNNFRYKNYTVNYKYSKSRKVIYMISPTIDVAINQPARYADENARTSAYQSLITHSAYSKSVERLVYDLVVDPTAVIVLSLTGKTPLDGVREKIIKID
jgi:hypothetical protein